jgi:hypothetical protein
MKLISYSDHPDPVTAIACLIAVVLGLNGPFYPLYVVAFVGWSQGHLAFLTMLATPLFLAVPLFARRAPGTGGLILWFLGTANTLWCTKLFGPSSGIENFLLPCIGLAALLPKNWLRLVGAGLPLLLMLMPTKWIGVPIIRLTAVQAAHLGLLNDFSAACLIGLLALRLGRLLPDAKA